MYTAWKIGAAAAALILALLVDHREAAAGKVEGVGIGAGVGAIVAGPVGAVVGGVVGYKVGGPNIVSGKRYTCWRDDRGKRRCGRR
jgi:outer membrane lipoprotein SlyB